MRHKKSFNHLGRKSAHRKAMLANMASSLVLHKRISTTTAKAKALRMYVEPLITKAKDDSTHSRRVVFSYLQNKEAVTELFREVGAKIADRPGGYTRILKTGTRLGDNADMCIIELVDYNENLLAAKAETKKKSTRRRRGGKKSTTATAEAQTEAVEAEESTEETKVEEVKAEETPATEEVKAETPKEEKPKAEAKEEKKAEPKPARLSADKAGPAGGAEKKETKKEEKKPEAKEEKKEAPKKEDKSEEKPARPTDEKEEK